MKESPHTKDQANIILQQAQRAQVKTFECPEYRYDDFNDIKYTCIDGFTLQGGNLQEMTKRVDISTQLKSITTTIKRDEECLYSVEFVFSDGTSQRVGGTNPKYAGRSQTIELQQGEILLGPVLYILGGNA